MRLLDLDPQWLTREGRRIGFTFRCPTNPQWRQSCFPDPPSLAEQADLFGDDNVQGCSPVAQWNIVGGIEAAHFATMTVTPSLDGSRGRLWHGHITAGEIVGGLPS